MKRQLKQVERRKAEIPGYLVSRATILAVISERRETQVKTTKTLHPFHPFHPAPPPHDTCGVAPRLCGISSAGESGAFASIHIVPEEHSPVPACLPAGPEQVPVPAPREKPPGVSFSNDRLMASSPTIKTET